MSQANRDRVVVVLDDDPTGTQCVEGVRVLLDPQADPASALVDSDALYILTNTRAYEESSAVELLRTLRTSVEAAAAREGREVEFVLRGDSTLRGHVFAESDVFGAADGVLVFVPAFPAAGRTTVGGVHHVEVGGVRLVAADTEFAADPVFGYSARTMVEWVREVGDRPAVVVPLDVVRRKPTQIAEVIRSARPGTAVVPDVETDGDLALVSAALDRARRLGASVVLRCAAPLAARRAHHHAAALLPAPIARVDGGTLVVCGSHTSASSRQLAALATTLEVPVRSLSTAAALADSGRAGGQIGRVLTDDLRRHGVAILASERTRQPTHASLHHGAQVMRALCEAVTVVRDQVTAVIAKGGITSAEVAVRGLGAATARVRGPLLTGVPVWDLLAGADNTIAYAVVPGNVGDDQTLVDVARPFGLGPARPHEERA
ncbi:four-carbon acid sugar kinase family protein [Actinopolymorpha alba]|uniref:four-carbon acid sugar kinase family protein n=1 Tax=Actinopolymorpha alba TaxID=533267 RepID=UPI000368BB23|nr:four-carbon acid sugar kinase family protein [Actinopolymorpha alba]